MHGLNRAPWLILALLLGACAGVQPKYESPSVSVASLKLLPTGSMMPQFSITLHVVNPNREPLRLNGIAYSVYLEGHKVITGAANNLPEIEGYGEGDIKLIATIRLLESLRLLSELIGKHRDSYHYKIDAKLDIGGGKPQLHVVDEGAIDLVH